jgi:hypothetical protein
MRPIGFLLLLGLLAAACGGGESAGSGGQVAGSRLSYRGYSGTAIVSADGRTLTVGLYPAEACPATIKPVARESATRVALFLEYTTPPNPPSCHQAAVALVDARDITLGAPLGDRRLVDGASGRAVASIGARLVLRPTVLPAGYRLSELVPAGSLSFAAGPRPAGCVQVYVSKADATQRLVIAQSAAGARIPGPGPNGWTSIRIRGHPGLATRNLITWRERGLTDYIVVGNQDGPQEPQVLTTQRLTTIADAA